VDVPDYDQVILVVGLIVTVSINALVPCVFPEIVSFTHLSEVVVELCQPSLFGCGPGFIKRATVAKPLA
jgi:hypothetical protein